MNRFFKNLFSRLVFYLKYIFNIKIISDYNRNNFKKILKNTNIDDYQLSCLNDLSVNDYLDKKNKFYSLFKHFINLNPNIDFKINVYDLVLNNQDLSIIELFDLYIKNKNSKPYIKNDKSVVSYIKIYKNKILCDIKYQTKFSSIEDNNLRYLNSIKPYKDEKKFNQDDILKTDLNLKDDNKFYRVIYKHQNIDLNKEKYNILKHFYENKFYKQVNTLQDLNNTKSKLNSLMHYNYYYVFDLQKAFYSVTYEEVINVIPDNHLQIKLKNYFDEIYKIAKINYLYITNISQTLFRCYLINFLTIHLQDFKNIEIICFVDDFVMMSNDKEELDKAFKTFYKNSPFYLSKFNIYEKPKDLGFIYLNSVFRFK